MTTIVPAQGQLSVALGGGAELVEARFVSRPNRFLVEAILDGALVQAHLHDRGRLEETLIPGARILLAHKPAAKRKTAFQAVAAYVDGRLASIDTVLPNRLIETALRQQALPPFASYATVRREASFHASRFDFLLTEPITAEQLPCIVEVKSAGLIVQDCAFFPDAPTERGRRHLRELAALTQEGMRSAVVFVVQGTACELRIDDQIDPAFAATLTEVAEQGVEIYCYSCPLTVTGMQLGEQISVFAGRNSNLKMLNVEC